MQNNLKNSINNIFDSLTEEKEHTKIDIDTDSICKQIDESKVEIVYPISFTIDDQTVEYKVNINNYTLSAKKLRAYTASIIKIVSDYNDGGRYIITHGETHPLITVNETIPLIKFFFKRKEDGKDVWLPLADSNIADSDFLIGMTQHLLIATALAVTQALSENINLKKKN